jgi:hypothetical protein
MGVGVARGVPEGRREGSITGSSLLLFCRSLFRVWGLELYWKEDRAEESSKLETRNKLKGSKKKAPRGRGKRDGG